MKLRRNIEKNKATRAREERPYGSWDPLTQARYIRDMGEATGKKISMAEAYKIAVTVTKPDRR
jgi:hypothetical protein